MSWYTILKISICYMIWEMFGKWFVYKKDQKFWLWLKMSDQILPNLICVQNKKLGIWTVIWFFHYTTGMFNTRCCKKWLFFTVIPLVYGIMVYILQPFFCCVIPSLSLGFRYDSSFPISIHGFLHLSVWYHFQNSSVLQSVFSPSFLWNEGYYSLHPCSDRWVSCPFHTSPSTPAPSISWS